MRTLYTADFVLPMDPGHSVIPDGALLVDGSEIVAVGPAADLEPAAAATPGTAIRPQRDRLLMPGMVNTHMHSGLLRGTAEQLPVWEWLRVHIDPMHRVLRPEEAEAAAWLCYAEAILSGTTTVVDMWRFLHGAVRAATQLGNRLVTANYTGAHPDHDYFDTPDDNERLLRTAHGTAGGRIGVWVGLEHPFYADEAGMRGLISMARDYDTGIYTHCSESNIEPPEFERRYAKRPMFALEDLGFFTAPKAMIAHGVWLDSAEIQLLAQRQVGIAHNPVSNMKLASGMAPVAEYLAAGVNVGIGTDGEKENNNLDMFEEMKTASLLAKLRAMDAAALGSWQVLRMATMGGAAALRLDDQIGSLEPGKKADFIAVRTDTPRMTPLFSDGPHANLHHNLVHAVRGSDVDLVVIDGTVVAEAGRLANADLAELIARARAAVPGLFARRAEYLAAHAGSLPGAFPATTMSSGQQGRPHSLWMNLTGTLLLAGLEGAVMTEDHVALDDWYPVADAGPTGQGPTGRGSADAFTTRLLGHPIRVVLAGARTRIAALRGDGQELRELPVTERFGLVWTTLGSPAKEVYDLPEAHEADRRYVRCGWVTLRTSAPRIVENFLDMAHFPFVHPGVLGSEPWTEVADYEAEIRRDVDEVWATSCKFFQPRVAATESDGAYAALTYRVPSPFQVMLYRVCPTAPERLDAILLAVHPVDEHLCRAQPVEYLVDDDSPDNALLSFEQAIFLQDRFIVENQRPLSLPLGPGAEIPVRADNASMTYRRWLREKKLTFGVIA